MPTISARSQRINLRASARQERLLRQAAEASDTSLTDFVLGSAVSRAERVLADQRWFIATQSQYQQFLMLLDDPVPTDKLAALFAREPVFDKPFTTD